jgi:hypothetical protein
MNFWQHVMWSFFALAFAGFALFFLEYATKPSYRTGKLLVYRLIIGAVTCGITVALAIFLVVIQFTGLPQ